MIGIIREISYKEAIEFLLPKHYSGRKPNIIQAFGWFFDKDLKAVCSFGKPASHALCIGVCGKRFSKYVVELNRLCREDDLDAPLSYFVAKCLKRLKDAIVVSYADTAMQHHGYIYQACNFLYTGATKKRTDKYTEGNKHSRHYNKNVSDNIRKVRSSKHRYIYFCSKIKSLKKEWLYNLRYEQKPYPKGENKKYKLGDFLEPELVYK